MGLWGGLFTVLCAEHFVQRAGGLLSVGRIDRQLALVVHGQSVAHLHAAQAEGGCRRQGVAPVAALASAALADQQHASGQLAVRHLHRPKAQHAARGLHRGAQLARLGRRQARLVQRCDGRVHGGRLVARHISPARVGAAALVVLRAARALPLLSCEL